MRTHEAVAVALVVLAVCDGGSDRNKQDLAKAELLYKQHSTMTRSVWW